MPITKIEDVNTLLAIADAYAARPVQDTIRGTNGDDSLYGDEAIADSTNNVLLAVNDRMVGLGGSDSLFGGLGDDSLNGGPGADYLDGSDGSDLLLGGDSIDILHGGAGDDVLDGGDGADIMRGGPGNNVYFADDINDQALEDADDPDDSNDSVVSTATFTLGEKIEQLVLTGNAAIDGTGNDLDNVLVGNKGTNILQGNKGADLYYVQNSEDTVLEIDGEDTDHATKWDKVFSSATWEITSNSKIDELELLGSRNIHASGNEFDNVIIGNAGNNRITGGEGNDTLGGIPLTVNEQDGTQWKLITAFFGLDNGVDRLLGGIGDDTYFLGKADRAIEGLNEGFDTIVTDFSFKLGANIEGLDFRAHLGSTIALVGTGNELANYFRSNLGADRLIGKGESDHYEVYNSAVKVIEKVGEGDADTVLAHVDFRLPINVENLILQDQINGFTPFKGFGNKSNNLIFGNVENNFLDGRAGDDVIDGGKGNDQLTGGPGFDDFVFSSELDAGANVDGIHDFRSADDQIVLSQELFGGLPEGILTSANFESILGSTATLAVPEIIFDQNTGKLYYDADGTGTTEPVAFAVLDPTPVGYVGMVSASDFEVVSLA